MQHDFLKLARLSRSGVAKENLIQSMTHKVQVVDLGTESAFEVGNARETDPASSDFLPNDLAGRVWHQAVALDDGRVVIGGGLGRKHLRDNEYEVTHEAGVAFEVCGRSNSETLPAAAPVCVALSTIPSPCMPYRIYVSA